MPELQSRRGSTSVAPSVRHENSSISASYSDSPAGAARSRSALAATETSAATKPMTRVAGGHCRQDGREPGNRPIADGA